MGIWLDPVTDPLLYRAFRGSVVLGTAAPARGSWGGLVLLAVGGGTVARANLLLPGAPLALALSTGVWPTTSGFGSL